jgi:hypothetical protein
MNAQEKWKDAYRAWKKELNFGTSYYGIDEADEQMTRYAREAALERIISRQDRRIAELQDQAWRLEAQIPNHDNGVRLSWPWLDEALNSGDGTYKP